MTAVLDASLDGHLSVPALRLELDRVARLLDELAEPPSVLLDCLSMTGYDPRARDVFVAWNRTYRDRIRRLAIVVSNPRWFVVVATMSLVSSQRMKAFSECGPAREWARQ